MQNGQQVKRNLNGSRTYRVYRKYKDGFAVLCKCPFCGCRHIVNMTAPPIITPRVYCDDHKYLRYSDADAPDVRNLSIRYNNRRAANK
jgi:hypothetical protein